jgi:hypothetical protein
VRLTPFEVRSPCSQALPLEVSQGFLKVSCLAEMDMTAVQIGQLLVSLLCCLYACLDLPGRNVYCGTCQSERLGSVINNPAKQMFYCNIYVIIAFGEWILAFPRSLHKPRVLFFSFAAIWLQGR